MAVCRPCKDTLSPLYQVIKSVQGSILEIIPEQIMINFQVECTRILRNLDDHMGNLFCLAILAKIASAPQLFPSEKPRWLRSICQFFDATRGLKTLDLAFLRAILVYSGNSVLFSSESVQYLQLVKEICEAVEPTQKTLWLTANKPKIIKLCEKVIKSAASLEVQMMGLGFLVSFVPAEMLPNHVVELVQQRILSEDSNRVLYDTPADYLSLLIQNVSPRFDQPTISRCIAYIMMHLDDFSFSTDIHMVNVGMARSMLSGLAKKSESSSSLKASIKAALLAIDREKMKFQCGAIRPSPDHSQCGQCRICPVAASLRSNYLSLELGALVLNLFNTSPPTESSQQLSFLWEKTLINLKSSLEISYPLSRIPPKVGDGSVHGMARDQYAPDASRDWRSKLSQHLHQLSDLSYSEVVRQVQDVCQDFEMRCENVEAPLRSMSAEMEGLAAKCEAAKLECEKLTNKTTEDAELIARLRSENDDLCLDVERLATDLKSTKANLQDSIQTNQKAIHSAREKAQDLEIRYSAIIAAKDDVIEELRERTEQLNLENDKLEALRQEALTSTREAQSETKELQGIIAAKEELCRNQESIINTLQGEALTLNSSLEKAEGLLKQKTSQCLMFEEKCQVDSESYERAVETLKECHETEVSRLNDEMSVMRASHLEEQQTWETTLETVKLKASRAVKEKGKKIESLEYQLSALRQEYGEKAREMAKAQEYSNRLMAVFNPSHPAVPTHFEPLHGPQGSGNARSGYTDREAENMSLTTESFGPINSTAPSPTPKRRRNAQRRSMGPVGSVNNKKSEAGRPRKRLSNLSSTPPASRQPLLQLNTNSPVKGRNRSSPSKIIDGDGQHLSFEENSVQEDISTF
ncbi:predicted protein [Uncinocarpus reesii 1704]|uniref:Uncharacterized protein n=1 Tax=Uncinocarpus reesii (strain UAMH 1704) TaxID=336963 RepID=C4JE23_UNCRE|nr:uncharacterized protein UREG_00447 [Uncinocarpus reesii 1704]EEP75601.1 predicted protein [Uncinocarpus reesii 1704]